MFYRGYFHYERGYASAPERPGLGIDLDEKVAAKFPYEEKTIDALHFTDGSVTDR